jgi:hypothetical protein
MAMNLKRYFLAVLCVALFGCPNTNDDGVGYDKDEAEYKWGEWDDPRLISIADDSLAVLAVYKPYFKEWKDCGFEGCRTETETTNYRVGLFLINYREKQKPVLGDTLEHDLTVVKDYFRDSSALVFDGKHNKFGFWKIGTKEIEFVDYMDYSGYRDPSGSKGYVYFDSRPFPNGNIFLFGGSKGDVKLLLDVKNRQIKPFEFSGEYEWLSECVTTLDDRYSYYDNYKNISYIGGELSCIRGNGTANNFELTVNNVVTDTSRLSKSNIERITGWYGNYVKDAVNKIYKIDALNFKFDSNYMSMLLPNDYYRPSFYSQNGNGDIYYTVQDLFEFFEQ